MSMAERVEMQPVDSVEITIVMDNSIDILAGPSEFGVRPSLGRDALEVEQLRAEHGYSLAFTIHRGMVSSHHRWARSPS